MADHATEFGQVVDLQYLFAAPLVAVIEADVLAAKEFVKFIKDEGFEKEHPGSGPAREPGSDVEDLGRLRTVVFFYQRLDSRGHKEWVEVSVPLLSLFPLPLLQVSHADFDFDVRIFDAVQERRPENPADLTRDPDHKERSPRSLKPDRYRFRAMLARRGPETTRTDLAPHLDANMRVKVAMRQADVPAGIATLLNVMGEAVHGAQKAEPPQS